MDDEARLLKEKYDGLKTDAFRADCVRLQSGEPLAYVIGHIPFMNTTIYLDSRPLIPRPETEWWTERAILEIQTRPASRILDLCAGSGAIGVAVLKAVPDAHVTFAEIDPRHHDTIGRNLRENEISEARATIVGGDLFERVEGRYDYILSNPPYIDPALDRTETSVSSFEPHTALYGGHEGCTFIEAIIKQGKQYLTDDGVLYIEHEPEQSLKIQELARAHGFHATTVTDQYDLERYSVLRLHA